jgi:hydrogenase maturation protease
MGLKKTAIVGVGNMLMGDEGAGVEAARMIEERLKAACAARGGGAAEAAGRVEAACTAELIDAVEVFDAGTAFFSVVSELHGFDRLIILDAVRGGSEPGTVYRFEPRDAHPRDTEQADSGAGLSLHDIGVLDSLRLERLSGKLTDNVVIYGIEPASIELRIGLSDQVQRRLGDMVERVLEEALHASSVG